MVVLETNVGKIVIELDLINTPETAKNFLKNVKNHHYDGTIFHRVMDGFMIQGGGFNEEMQQKPTQKPIQNEANKGSKNTRGSVAMARTSEPHSATAQFFINVVDNHFLDFTSESINGWGYCVFGKVVEGMEVVDKIKKVKTGNRAGHQNVPIENIVIKTVTVQPSADDDAS